MQQRFHSISTDHASDAVPLLRRGNFYFPQQWFNFGTWRGPLHARRHRRRLFFNIAVFFTPREFLVVSAFNLAWPRLCMSFDDRSSWQLAEELKPLMMGLDKDIPVITSHSLVGMTAVACGFK